MQVESVRSAADSPRAVVVLGGVLAAGLLFAHLQPVRAMIELWSVSPMYSYAFTVPFISAYLLYSRQQEFAKLKPRGSWRAAGPVLVAGIGLLLFGRAAGVVLVQQVAFIVCLLGVLLALFGPVYVRTGWAGLAYLLLMIPLWDGLTEPLHMAFQDRSATLAIGLMRAVGIPAYRDGLSIEVPGASLEVARACSGVNYLVAVVALGLPLSYLYLRSPWRRLALLAGAVLVAAFSNGLRVALIGGLAYNDIDAPLHGPFHVLHGLFVAGIGYVALFAGLRWLSRHEPPAAPTLPVSMRAGLAQVRISKLGVLAAVFWALALVPYARQADEVTGGASLGSLPLRIGEWTGTPLTESTNSVARWWPGADEHLFRRYATPDGRQVDVFIGYFAPRQQRRLGSSHADELHAPAIRTEVAALEGGTFAVNRVQLPSPDRRDSMFWYVIDGEVLVGRHSAALRAVWRALFGGPSSGTVVLIASDNGQTTASLGEFAARLQGALSVLLSGQASTPVMAAGAGTRSRTGIRTAGN